MEMTPLFLIGFQVALSLAALITLVSGFFIGVRYHVPNGVDRAMCCAMFGLLAGTVGIFALAMGYSYVWTTALITGGFMAGLGIGLQVVERD